jgi:hypothetical protein
MVLSFTVLPVTYSVGGLALVGKQYQQLHAVDSFHSRKLENFKLFEIVAVFLLFNLSLFPHLMLSLDSLRCSVFINVKQHEISNIYFY